MSIDTLHQQSELFVPVHAPPLNFYKTCCPTQSPLHS